MARNRGLTVGNTRGGRGPLPANIQTMGDYYNSGRSSAFNPKGAVRNQQGKNLNGGKSSS